MIGSYHKYMMPNLLKVKNLTKRGKIAYREFVVLIFQRNVASEHMIFYVVHAHPTRTPSKLEALNLVYISTSLETGKVIW